MPMSRTPKREASMFDPIEQDEDNGLPSREELAQQLAEVQRELEAERKRIQAAARPMEPVPQAQVYTADTVKLPDPAVYPEEYAKAIEQNTRAKLEAEERTRKAFEERKGTVEKRMNALWDDFAEQHEDKAKDKRKIEFAAAAVLQRAKDRGYDPEKFMLGSPQAFIDDVAREYENVFGQAQAGDDEYADEDRDDDYEEPVVQKPRRKHRRTRPVERDEDDSRAASIFGGNESPFSRGKRGKKDEEGPSMIDDIQNMQRRMGIM